MLPAKATPSGNTTRLLSKGLPTKLGVAIASHREVDQSMLQFAVAGAFVTSRKQCHQRHVGHWHLQGTLACCAWHGTYMFIGLYT